MKASITAWLFCASLFVGGCATPPTADFKGFAIDSARPYLEIAYDHIGPRQPVRDGESSIGLWLLFRNNCPYNVELPALSAANPNDGHLLQYEIDVSRPLDAPVITEKGQPQQDLKDISDVAALKPALGYRQLTHTGPVVQLAPGEDVLFSIPIEHLSRRVSLQVHPRIEFPPIAGKNQPITVVEFTWNGLPADVVRDWDRLSATESR